MLLLLDQRKKWSQKDRVRLVLSCHTACRYWLHKTALRVSSKLGKHIQNIKGSRSNIVRENSTGGAKVVSAPGCGHAV